MRNETSDVNTPALVKAGLLAALGIMVWVKFLDGSLNFYVHPRYNGLIAVTGGLMTLIGLVGIMLALGKGSQTQAHNHKSDALTYAVLFVPLVFGILIPAKPLGVNAIQEGGTRAVTGSSNLSTANRPAASTSGNTAAWTLLEWGYALNEDAALTIYKGKPVDLVGFAFTPKSGVVKGGGQYYVARYVVVCCTADSTAVSLPVIATGSSAPTNNAWVHLRGTITQVTGADGAFVAAIRVETQETIKQPPDPYLYP